MTLRPETDLQVVVTNAAGVLSRWPGHRALPRGWSALGRPAPRASCLAEIDRLSSASPAPPSIATSTDSTSWKPSSKAVTSSSEAKRCFSAPATGRPT